MTLFLIHNKSKSDIIIIFVFRRGNIFASTIKLVHFLLLIFHVLNLLQIADRLLQSDPVRLEHKVNIFPILTIMIPELSYSLKLILYDIFVTINKVIEIGVESGRGIE